MAKCKGCGRRNNGRQSVRSPAPPPNVQVNDAGEVLIEYRAGKALVPVVGPSRRAYGEHKGGDRFYVSVEDARLWPSIFLPVPPPARPERNGPRGYAVRSKA